MSITTSAGYTWRDYSTEGLPSSGVHEPVKSEIRTIFGLIDSTISTIVLASALGVLLYTTKAAMDADLAHDANTLALVYADSTAANNQIYRKTGASGSGSWVATALTLPTTVLADLAELDTRLDTAEGDIDAVDTRLTAAEAKLAKLWNALPGITADATTDIGAVASDYVAVVGTATITALGTATSGQRKIVYFSGTPTLTHNATSLITTTGANIVVAAGDHCCFVSLGSGNWRMVWYARRSGESLATGPRLDAEIIARIAADAALDARLDTAESEIDSLQSDVSNIDERLDIVEGVADSLAGPWSYFIVGDFDGRSIEEVNHNGEVIKEVNSYGYSLTIPALSSLSSALSRSSAWSYVVQTDDEISPIDVNDEGWLISGISPDGRFVADIIRPLTADKVRVFLDLERGVLRRIGGTSWGADLASSSSAQNWKDCSYVEGRAQAVYEDADGVEHLVSVGADGTTWLDGKVHVYRGLGQSTSIATGGAGLLYPYINSAPTTLGMIKTVGTFQDARLGTHAGGGSTADPEVEEADLVGIIPLITSASSTNRHGTTPIEGFAMREITRARAQCGGWSPSAVVVAMGQGGEDIAALSPGGSSNDYENGEVVTEWLQGHYEDEGVGTVHEVVLMRQGQSDTGNADLGADHEALRAANAVMIQGVTGQPQPLTMIACQESSFMTSHDGVRDMLRQHIASVDGAGHYILSNPTYADEWDDVSSSPYLHHTSLGYFRSGWMASIAWERYRRYGFDVDAGGWDVMRIVDWEKTSSTVLKLWWTWEISNDTTWVTTLTNRGLGLGSLTVTDISTSGKLMTITSSNSNASLTQVDVALSGHGEPRTALTIPRSTICGPVLDTDPYGFPFRPRAVHQRFLLA